MDSQTRSLLKDMKARRAVGNPKVRNSDPECWKCLSDEQRDMINEWYIDRLLEKEDLVEKDLNKHSNAGYFALTPFAFTWALFRNSELSIWLFVYSAGAWVILSLIYYIVSSAYISFSHTNPWQTKLGAVFFHAIFSVIIFFVVYIFFTQTNMI